jgi:ubiquinone/menaquinone biosynthesis C-methylase UbiE
MTTRSPQSFDAFAETYDRLVSLSAGFVRSHLEAVLPAQGRRAVDLGCGTGHHAVMLAARFDEVLGVDVSPPMLEVARARRCRSNISYELRDLHDVTPEKDGRFDLVFSASTLHHVPDLDDALRRIRALVSPGGRVVLLDNVSARPSVPGWWFRREALRRLAGDLAGRRRPLREAIEVFRLQTHPAWLDHVTSDRFLSPAEFRRRYGDVFPGGDFTDLYRTCILTWHDELAAKRPDDVAG